MTRNILACALLLLLARPACAQDGVFYSQACHTFVFQANSDSVSEPYPMKSVEYIRRSLPSGISSDSPTGNIIARKVSVVLANHQQPPWGQEENFTICLTGKKYSLTQRAGAKYSEALKDTGTELIFTLTQQGGTAQPPDPESIELSVDDAGLRLHFTDHRHWNFSGGTTVIHIKLRKDGGSAWYNNPEVFDGSFKFASAAAYEIALPTAMGERFSKLPGGNYFVEWGFSRLGSPALSSGQEVFAGRTESFRIR